MLGTLRRRWGWVGVACVLAACLAGAAAGVAQARAAAAPDPVQRLLPEGAVPAQLAVRPQERAKLVRELQAEQASASGDRAQQVAFLLAALGVRYTRNRNMLLHAPSGCRFPDVRYDCDDMTGDYLIYLYRHGHDELLAALMRGGEDSYCAECQEGIGAFLGELAVRAPRAFLAGLAAFPAALQARVCGFAAATDGSGLAPSELARVRRDMGAIRTPAARRCVAAIEAESRGQ